MHGELLHGNLACRQAGLSTLSLEAKAASFNVNQSRSYDLKLVFLNIETELGKANTSPSVVLLCDG